MGWVVASRARTRVMAMDTFCMAWCQYGCPEELPNIYHRKQYEGELHVLPDYRITWMGTVAFLEEAGDETVSMTARGAEGTVALGHRQAAVDPALAVGGSLR